MAEWLKAHDSKSCKCKKLRRFESSCFRHLKTSALTLVFRCLESPTDIGSARRSGRFDIKRSEMRSFSLLLQTAERETGVTISRTV